MMSTVIMIDDVEIVFEKIFMEGKRTALSEKNVLYEIYGVERKREIDDAEKIHKEFNLLSEHIFKHYLESGYDSLTDKEKSIRDIDIFLQDVNNGGLDQYFNNTECMQTRVDDLLDMLRKFEDDTYTPLICIGLDIYNGQLDQAEKSSKLHELDKIFYKLDIFEYARLYKCCIKYDKECGA